MNTSSQIAYFGYGSLVNLDTLRTPYISVHRARLKGWRRVWLSRPKLPDDFAPDNNVALLSVEPDKNSTIEGLIITDHKSSLPSLDEREALYDRVNLKRSNLHFLDGDPLKTDEEVYLYVAQYPPAENKTQILRSYLDAVMQGYLTQFSEEGVRSFMATTANFDCEILEDRASPIYPRAVALSAEEQELFMNFV